MAASPGDWFEDKLWSRLFRFSVNDEVCPPALIERIEAGRFPDPDADYLAEPRRYLQSLRRALDPDQKITYEVYFDEIGDLDRFLMAVPGDQGIYVQHVEDEIYHHVAVEQMNPDEDGTYRVGITDIDIEDRFNRFDYQSIDFGMGATTDKQAFANDLSGAVKDVAPSPIMLGYEDDRFDSVHTLRDEDPGMELVRHLRAYK